MVKTSSLTNKEVKERTGVLDRLSDSLYFWSQEQNFDIWIAYCNMRSTIERFADMLETELEK